jgi:hypothetical protein
MKQTLTSFRIFSAIALLALAVGCASTQSKENSLVAAGFIVIVPKTIPPDKVTMVQKSGKTYYVFPDTAHNKVYVGGPKQYEAYKKKKAAPKANVQDLVVVKWIDLPSYSLMLAL